MDTCLYVRTNGSVCNAFPLKGEDLCYFHKRDQRHQRSFQRALDHKRSTLSRWATVEGLCQTPQMKRPFDDHFAALFSELDLPPLEDAAAIQVAITNVVRAIASQQIDPRSAGLLLYALQIASSNIGKVRLKPTVTENYAEEVSEDLYVSEFEQVLRKAAVPASPVQLDHVALDRVPLDPRVPLDVRRALPNGAAKNAAG